MGPAELTAVLDARARSAGVLGFGIASAAPFAAVRTELERRTASGERGELGFTYLRPEVATDVSATFPWARSLAVMASSYLPDAGSPPAAAPGSGRIARFATRDHYIPLRRAAGAVAGLLRRHGYRAEVLCDDNRLVDRAAAVRAGVGWWGKSTLVLVPGAGPWVLLATVVTDAHLPVSAPMVRTCGTCVACIEACPTGAIVAPGILDARRCIAHWAQVPGVVPVDMRAAMGDRLYGCDDCLDACPPGTRLLEESTRSVGRHQVLDILAATDRELLRDFGHLYLPKRRPGQLRRNALIVAGNSGDLSLFDVVAGYTGHPHAVLRAHAVWALHRIAPGDAAPVLAFVARDERDDAVVDELRQLGVLV